MTLPVVGSAQGEQAPSATPSGYADATAALRATARWIVTALAGVAGVLLAGVPLTGLGGLQSGTARGLE